MARTRVRRRLGVLLLAAAATGVLSGPVATAVARDAGRAGSGRTHVVRPGDTLWAIAERFSPDVDPRIVVDAIADANALDLGALVPGQQLTIPAVG